MKFKDAFPLFLIILLSLIALIPLFQPGFMGYDFVFQCARLASFYKNLKEGVILPRWAGTLNADFGHPVLIFLYPFVFYLGSFWHFLGFSLVDSIKILLGLGFILSGIFMYLAARKLWGEKTAFVCSLLYLFNPYRFVNLYERAALGEHLATTFLPLVFLALATIFQNKKLTFKNGLFLGLSTALTILSHNLIILMASPLILAFLFFLLFQFPPKKNLKKKLLFVSFGFVLALALSSFFWVPIVSERKYTRYDEIANPTYYSISLLTPKQIILSPNYSKLERFFSLKEDAKGGIFLFSSISPIQWLLTIFGIYFVINFWGKRKKETLFVLFLVVYFLFGAFLSTKNAFFLVKIFPQIALFQQACRFLNLPLLVTPFLAAILFDNLIKKKTNYLLGVLIILNLFFTLPYFWNLKIPLEFKSDSYFYNEYKLTADTGQITPVWSLINYFEPAPQKVQLVSGGLDEVKIYKWHSQEHIYTLKLREKSQIADNTLYFPGWKVWVDDRQVAVNFQDMNWRGIITYSVPVGEHEVKVKFTETKVRLLADYLSLATLFFMIFLFLFSKKVSIPFCHYDPPAGGEVISKNKL